MLGHRSYPQTEVRLHQIDMLTPPTAYPICTIANTPRLPEHCIEWASVLEWPKVFKGVSKACKYPLLSRTDEITCREKARHR